MGWKDWFKPSPPKPPCIHSIGENTSVETYVWHGRNPTPYKHHVTFTCEKCGEYVRQIMDDAQKTYQDAVKGRY